MEELAIFETLSPEVKQKIVASGVYFLDVMVENNITFEEFKGMVEARNISKRKTQ